MLEVQGFKYAFLPYPSFDDGALMFGVVCKRTYRLVNGGRALLDEAQLPLFTADVYWEESQPLLSSVKHEVDTVPCKPKTDVVVNARAYAPGGKPVDQMTVAVEVHAPGERRLARKEILVVGDRFCTHVPPSSPQISYPLPFDQMPLRYEYAYGGIDPEGTQDGGFPYPKNPVGVGFAISSPNASPSVDGMPLPNLEDPKDRLTPDRVLVPYDRIDQAPVPAGFGWYGKGWVPRILKAGIPRAQRKLWEAAHDLKKADAYGGAREFDLEYFNGASPGLALPYLRGDERIAVEGLDPGGRSVFELPGERVRVALDLAGEGLREVPMQLTTVALLREDDRLYQIWSGAISYRSNADLWEKGMSQVSIEAVPL